MAASGWTTAAGWMKLPDASRAAAWESLAWRRRVVVVWSRDEKYRRAARATAAAAADMGGTVAGL